MHVNAHLSTSKKGKGAANVHLRTACGQFIVVLQASFSSRMYYNVKKSAFWIHYINQISTLICHCINLLNAMFQYTLLSWKSVALHDSSLFSVRLCYNHQSEPWHLSYKNLLEWQKTLTTQLIMTQCQCQPTRLLKAVTQYSSYSVGEPSLHVSFTANYTLTDTALITKVINYISINNVESEITESMCWTLCST